MASRCVGVGTTPAARRLGLPDRHDVADHLGTDGLAEERLGHGAERDPGGGLAGAGPLEHRAGVVEVVLLHADEVGVARARTRQRRVARLLGQQLRVDRVGRHHRLPLGPLAVADLDGDRAAHGEAVPDPADDPHGVLLELHPGTATVAEPATGQLLRRCRRS